METPPPLSGETGNAQHPEEILMKGTHPHMQMYSKGLEGASVKKDGLRRFSGDSLEEGNFELVLEEWIC